MFRVWFRALGFRAYRGLGLRASTCQTLGVVLLQRGSDSCPEGQEVLVFFWLFAKSLVPG